MEQYYTTEDFKEFSNVDRNITIEQLTDGINHIISEKEQVCDFYICMSKIYQISRELYNSLKNLIKNYNPYGAYLFIKFLLFDDDYKISFKNRYIDRMINFKRSMDKDYILREIYELSNDEELNNFMEFTDNFNVYKPLDLSKLHNIKHDSIFTTHYYQHGLLILIGEYIKITFLHNFIYYISNSSSYTSMLRDGEISITGLEDFNRRFMSSIDIHMILWNYMNIFMPYSRNENTIKLYIDKIPSDKKYNIYHNDDIILSEEDKIHLILTGFKKIVNTVLTTQNEPYLPIFLKLKLNYEENYPNDGYNVIKKYNYKIDKNQELLKRIKQYCQSKLYKSLYMINNFKNKLNIVNNETHKELYDYLTNLLEKHNYDSIYYL